ncbi:hypothetical protein SEEAA707_09455, partial [Salmonella enterica subsp. enterica serovar Agona str. ATCC BAA-707]
EVMLFTFGLYQIAFIMTIFAATGQRENRAATKNSSLLV